MTKSIAADLKKMLTTMATIRPNKAISKTLPHDVRSVWVVSPKSTIAPKVAEAVTKHIIMLASV